jgi:pimeloyl-ACP methyl ester carboxylesterase
MEIDRGLVRTPKGYIHYRAAGAGPAIMLCHVNQQSSALMLELMQVLAPRHRVVAIDYPSHGHSDHVAGQPLIDDYADSAIAVLDALGIDKASVMGEAVGAATSIAFASGHPDRVIRTVLVNCPFYADRSIADRNHAPLKTGLRPSDPSGFPLTRTVEFMKTQDPGHAPMEPSQSWMDRINVAQLEVGRDRWQALDALHDFDVVGRLGQIACPVLLLMGEHFHYVPFMEQFHARLPSLRSEIIPNGRFCMTWERAEDVGRKAMAFIAEG